MYGAILGDIIGSRFEFDRGGKTKDFGLLTDEDNFTDDSVMTVAVADALIKIDNNVDDETVKSALIKSMQEWGNKYPWAGYGQSFFLWLGKKNPKPYGSWGNGSAMRVSSVGWFYDTLEETRRYARLSAEISHNHPEGIKGAECTATVIFLSRTGVSKEEIAKYIDREFAYDYSETLEEMRARHEHVESCQDSLPKALRSFFDGESYEDVVRNAVSLGGDTDTLAAIAGAMAEAFYGMPDKLKSEVRSRIEDDMLLVLDRFDECVGVETLLPGDVEYSVPDVPITPELLEGGFFLKRAIEICTRNRTQLNLLKLLKILRDSWVWIPCNAIMSDSDYAAFEKMVMVAKDEGNLDSLVGLTFTAQDETRMVPDILQNGDDFYFPVFTSDTEMGEYGDDFSKLEEHFMDAMILARNNEKNVKGIVINAFSEPFVIPREIFDLIAKMESSFETKDADGDE